MPIIQYQKGSLVTSIPTEVKKVMQLKKGDTIHFNITEDGEIKVIKIKEESK